MGILSANSWWGVTAQNAPGIKTAKQISRSSKGPERPFYKEGTNWYMIKYSMPPVTRKQEALQVFQPPQTWRKVFVFSCLKRWDRYSVRSMLSWKRDEVQVVGGHLMSMDKAVQLYRKKCVICIGWVLQRKVSGKIVCGCLPRKAVITRLDRTGRRLKKKS